jgi:hypothetical protein
MEGENMENSQADKKKCKGAKPDGSCCTVAALPGSDFCFFHDPARAGERQEAQALGGRRHCMKTLNADAPDVKVEDCQDVRLLIAETINQVRKGAIDPRVANAVGYLANVFIKAVEQGDLESRLKEIEAIVKNQRSSSELKVEI